MEKLINNFCDLIAQETYKNKNDIETLSDDIGYVIALECRKVAIDFAIYCDANGWTSPIFKDGTIKFMQCYSNEILKTKDLFNKFIEEKYEKTN